MDRSDEYLDQLDAHLAALPEDNYPMSVSELDGYLTGVLACTEEIPAADWLPAVWGETGEAEFPDAETAEATTNAVLTHFAAIQAALSQSSWIEPIYEMDPDTDEIVWEAWVNGFSRALRLRPDAWQAVLDKADEETQSALIFLMALQDIVEGESKLSEEEIDQLAFEAPDMVQQCIETILATTHPEYPQATE